MVTRITKKGRIAASFKKKRSIETWPRIEQGLTASALSRFEAAEFLAVGGGR